MPDIDLTVVIPAFGEGRKIQRDIRAARDFLEARRLRGEIIVVDDGSADDTADRARALEPEVPDLRVIRYHANRGKGFALRTGIQQSRGDIVMFADAGTCVPYESALMGLGLIRTGLCEIAHASRRARGSTRRRQPLYRRVGSRLYALFTHLVMGIPSHVTDTQCGFKLYAGDTARRLYAEAETDGFMFDVEVILRALRHGDRILEFPVAWTHDADTRYHPVRGTLRNLRELLRIRRMLA